MTVFNDTDKVIIYSPELGEADYFHADHGTVIIDSTLLGENQEHRYRFTMGHEAGHWIFHKSYYGYNYNQLTLFDMFEPYIQCREINNNYLDVNTQGWDSQRWMEWQADKFSAALLMPRTAVKKVLGNRVFTSAFEALLEINSIAHTFNVSKQAAYLRLCDLQIIPRPKTKTKSSQLSFL